MEVGDKVIHKEYGKGEIFNIDRDLKVVHVEFDSQLKSGIRNKWVHPINLRTIHENNARELTFKVNTNLDEIESQLDRVIDKLEKIEGLQEEIGNKQVFNFEGNVYGIEDLESKIQQAIANADREICR